MNKEYLLPLIITAIVIGIFVGRTWQRLELEEKYATNQKKIEEIEQPVLVVVARQNLEAGEIITNKSAAVRKFPQRYTPSYYVKADKFMDKLNEKYLIKPVNAGEPLLVDFVVDKHVQPFNQTVPAEEEFGN